jgi:hypothetical protein
MPDPSTDMISAVPQGVTPYKVPTGQAASHPIMDFIHNWATNKLGLAGQEMQQRESQRKQEAEALSNMAVQQPELTANQEFMKYLAKKTSPEFANALGQFSHVHSIKAATEAQAAQKILGGDTASSSAAPAPSGGDFNDLATAQAHRQKLQQFELAHQSSPMSEGIQKMFDEEMKKTDEQIKFYQQQLEENKRFQQTKEQQQQFHADSMQMHQDTLAQGAEFKGIMANLATEREKDAQEAHINQAATNLSTRLGNIAKLVTTNPDQAKPLIDAYNRDMKTFKTRAERAGIDYDSEASQPLTLKNVDTIWSKMSMGLIGPKKELGTEAASTDPTVVEGTVVEGPKGDRLVYKGGKWIPDTNAAK